MLTDCHILIAITEKAENYLSGHPFVENQGSDAFVLEEFARGHARINGLTQSMSEEGIKINRDYMVI